MKRRGVLGLLAGGIAAAPAMAQEAAGQILTGGGTMGLSGVLRGGGTSSTKEAFWDPLAEAKRELAQVLGKTAMQIAREKRQRQIVMFDGDIAAMRSLSWHAKVAMQRDRDWRRDHEQQRGWIEERIASLLENPST